jgi:hypothetical protein
MEATHIQLGSKSGLNIIPIINIEYQLVMDVMSIWPLHLGCYTRSTRPWRR